jgi:large subunit ribosomal protein L5
MKELGLTNIMECPKLNKIVLNMGVGEATQNSKLMDAAAADLAIISGQKPIVITAKMSEAGFKLREGQAIGTKVTLRGEAMYDFMDRLVIVILPRVRDFDGVSVKVFDGRGNYSLGMRD